MAKHTGHSAFVRDQLQKDSSVETITTVDIERILKEGGQEGYKQTSIISVASNLRKYGFLKAVGMQGKRTVYKVIRNEPSPPATKEYEAPGEGLVASDYATLIADLKHNHRIEIDKLNDKHKQEISDLEDKLLEEMSKVEKLKKGLDIDFVTLGKSVYRAHEELLKSFNELESSYRSEVEKWKKFRSEDKSMIGGLQKKVRDLEDQNARLREVVGQTNGKPDMEAFNSPRIITRKGGLS